MKNLILSGGPEGKSSERVALEEKLGLLAQTYQGFIADTAKKTVSDFTPHQKTIVTLMPKLAASSKGESPNFTEEELAALRAALAAAEKFQIISNIFGPKIQASLAAYTNTAQSIVATKAAFIKNEDDPCRDYYETFFGKAEIGKSSAGGKLVFEYCQKNGFLTEKLTNVVSEIHDANAIFILCKSTTSFNNALLLHQYLNCKNELPQKDTYIFVYEKSISDVQGTSGVNCFKATNRGSVIVQHVLVKAQTIFEPIDESIQKIENVSFDPKKTFDFFITKVRLLDANKEVLMTSSRSANFLPPSRGSANNDDVEQFDFYQKRATSNLFVQPFDVTRNGYSYNGKHSVPRTDKYYLRIEGANYEGAAFKTVYEDFEVSLTGMQKRLSLSSALQHSFKIASTTIDIDFKSAGLAIKEHSKTPLPHFFINNNGNKVYYWGSGSPAGTYTVIVYAASSNGAVARKTVSVKKPNISSTFEITVNSTLNNSADYNHETLKTIIDNGKRDSSDLLQSLINHSVFKNLEAIYQKLTTTTNTAALKGVFSILLNIGNAAGTCMGAFPPTAAAGAMLAGISAGLNILVGLKGDKESDKLDNRIKVLLTELKKFIDVYDKLQKWNTTEAAENAALYFEKQGGKADIPAISAFYKHIFDSYNKTLHINQLIGALDKLK